MLEQEAADDRADGDADPGRRRPHAQRPRPLGRVGEVTLDDTNSGAMAAPFQFDASNIEEFSKIY